MSRHRFTWLELVAVITVIGVLVGLLLPAVEQSREPARRIACNNQLKQIGLALHNYATANKMFPPGVVCSAANITADAANPWADARLTTKGASGASWILPLVPYIESESMFKAWDFQYGVSGGNNPKTASLDIKALYCPSRRSCLRLGVDTPMLLNSAWTGGGTDYGGCVGRHQAFLLDTDQSVALPNAEDKLNLAFVPGVTVANESYRVATDVSGSKASCEANRGFGVFGRVNTGSKFFDAKDGLASTIMTGELQRITDKRTVPPFSSSFGPIVSHDGWGIGGSSTLFTTGCPNPSGSTMSPLMNNGYFMSPGSDHPNGANFGIGDGSVRFVSTRIDPNIFAILGSMADSRPPIIEY